MKILLVEPNADLEHLLTFMLTFAGHEVLFAHQEEGALAVVEQVQPAAVLTAAQLPQGSGWSLCRTLRRIGRPPVIVLGSPEPAAAPHRVEDQCPHFSTPIEPRRLRVWLETLDGAPRITL